MTKVQIRLALARPLNEDDMAAIAEAHGIYGIARVRVDGTLPQIVVDYDASRLSPRDVETRLIGTGLPVVPDIV